MVLRPNVHELFLGDKVATFGIVFTKQDIENQIGDSVNDTQLEALVWELEDAFSYYWDRDLTGELRAAILEGEPATVDLPSAVDFEVSTTSGVVGKFLYTRADVENALGQSISDKDLTYVAEFFTRAFKKYFDEECERLWQDIDTIVEEFESEA